MDYAPAKRRDMKLQNGGKITSFYVPVQDRETRIESPHPDVLVFYINIGNVPTKDVGQYMEQVIESLKDKDEA